MREPCLARKARGEGDRQASRLTGLIPVFIAPEDDLQLVRVDGDSFDNSLKELTIRNLRIRLFFLRHRVEDKRLDIGRRHAGIEPALAFRFCSRACETL